MQRVLVGVALALYSVCSAACGADKSADAPHVVARPAVVDDRVMSPAADVPPTNDANARDSLIGLVTAPDSLLDVLETLEYDYDEHAVTVYAVRNQWYLARTRDSTRTWLRAAAVGAFMPLDSLIQDRLNYLTESWDGELRSAPAFSATRVIGSSPLRTTASDFDQTPARVLRTRRVHASTWWAEVEVMNTSGCDGDTPRVLATGWVPLWGTNRAPTVWYFSRGC